VIHEILRHDLVHFFSNSLIFEQKPACYLSISQFLYELAQNVSSLQDNTIISSIGMAGVKLMTLYDENLFEIGLRIIGLLLDYQNPDHDFL
jgi:hypothetical protein